MAVRWRSTAVAGPRMRQVLRTPCGVLEIQGQGETVTGLFWHLQPRQEEVQVGAGLEAVCKQLWDYFRHPETEFECELADQGTAFCARVWQALEEIPRGEVRTYGELARQLRTSPRAVAAACRANPYPILIPCHRVVAQAGLGGYCGQLQGAALAIKRWLLHHEGWRG